MGALGLGSVRSQAGVYFNPGFSLQRLATSNSVGDATNTNFLKAYVYSLELGAQMRRLTLGIRGDWIWHKIEAGTTSAVLFQPGVYGTLGLRFGGAISVRPLVGVGYLLKNELRYAGTASADGTYANPGLAGFGAMELGIYPGARRSWGIVSEAGYRFVVPSTVTLGASTLDAKTSGVFFRGGLSLRY